MSVEPWMDAWPPDARDPADGVGERAGALPSGVADECLCDTDESLRRDAADLLHLLRRVAREVALEHLEHAARGLQCQVLLRLGVHRRSARSRLLGPAGRQHPLAPGRVTVPGIGIVPGVGIVLPRRRRDLRSLVLPGLR